MEILQLNLDTNLSFITMNINTVLAQWFNSIKSQRFNNQKILLSELVRIQPVHLRDKLKLRFRNVQLKESGITETLTDPVLFLLLTATQTEKEDSISTWGLRKQDMNHTDAKCSKRYQQGDLFKEKLYSGFMTDIFGITSFCYCSQNIFDKKQIHKHELPHLQHLHPSIHPGLSNNRSSMIQNELLLQMKR